ncbi:hypothetical protein [Paragemmobacter straminiformis]|uniref:Glycosyltransferase 2-like domain-containing protein n=1 Tax=Paragemmobacter straminiformis TaxID=2045119 RepID=A0A842I6B0_9RHOB|nr:hypothetical protein [Gemmobacter straminiformis]MBC2835121.1 hypothetical protein [Gemmobacter straminiformis]
MGTMKDGLTRRIFVLGLCRNCANSLPALIKILTELRITGSFDIQVIFGENGSIDGTRELLERAAQEKPWLAVVDTSFMATISERLARMAAGREALRKSLPDAKSDDVVIVLDTDLELACPLSVNNLSKALAELDKPLTSGVCSYSVPFHYDILALRETENSNNPALDFYRLKIDQHNLWSFTWRPFARFLKAISVSRMQRRLGTASGRKFFSAFNGLCIYHRALFDDASYIGTGVECEHVVLHTNMHRISNGTIRVSSHIGVLAPPEYISHPLPKAFAVARKAVVHFFQFRSFIA